MGGVLTYHAKITKAIKFYFLKLQNNFGNKGLWHLGWSMRGFTEATKVQGV